MHGQASSPGSAGLQAADRSTIVTSRDIGLQMPPLDIFSKRNEAITAGAGAQDASEQRIRENICFSLRHAACAAIVLLSDAEAPCKGAAGAPLQMKRKCPDQRLAMQERPNRPPAPDSHRTLVEPTSRSLSPR